VCGLSPDAACRRPCPVAADITLSLAGLQTGAIQAGAGLPRKKKPCKVVWLAAALRTEIGLQAKRPLGHDWPIRNDSTGL